MLYLWVRSTVNWEDERQFRAQLDAAFAVKVDLWNGTFDMPYHRFRHEVRRIAQLNLARVENAAVRSWDEIPDGALVAPVDDDDWFAPQVATVLERMHEPDAIGYSWTSSFIEVPINLRHRLDLLRHALFPATRPFWICTTNNYAVLKRPDTTLMLEKHTVASVGFGGEHARRVRRIDQRLSAMNRTLASQTSLGFLRPTIRRAELLRKFRRYQALYKEPLAPELAWCRPYSEMMADLMRRVSVK
ncbi:MAG: hypothetical protein ABI629_21190 [bacterium]